MVKKMGCDIHLCVEILSKYTRKWCSMDTWSQDIFDTEDVLRCKHIFSDRNYTLFGILAGVRNHSVEPIASPRGFPDDASFVVRQLFEHYGSEHTPSWLTLKELAWYNWTPVHNETKNFEAVIEELSNKCGYMDFDMDDIRIVFWFDS